MQMGWHHGIDIVPFFFRFFESMERGDFISLNKNTQWKEHI
jgi:hypothetical protein